MEARHAVCAVLGLLCCIGFGQAHGGTFVIDSSNNTFLLNGKPFRYVSGSMHYFRVHPDYWEDRLLKLKAAGLNAVQTYVPWNLHEPEPGQYDFSGFADFERFLRLAQKHELYVLLRAGPFICAEWEFGGFPAWLLRMKPKALRTMDPVYIKYVDKWMHKLLPMVKPFLFVNGGPILMVQIENEYGSYYACDNHYLVHLRDLFLSLLGHDVTLYTTDGDSYSYLHCGRVDGVYTTVDFGIDPHNGFGRWRTPNLRGRSGGTPQSLAGSVVCNPVYYFEPQKAYEPHGPSVNSEFYTGWLDVWGREHFQTPFYNEVGCLHDMLKYGANVNMYMFEGGTNFGYFNGAYGDYSPVPTSYDYNAPLNESGDATPKYFAIRKVISQFLEVPKKVPPNLPKRAYGNVPLKFVSTVQDALKVLCPEGPHRTTYPIPMENIGHYYGFILYRTRLPKDGADFPLNVVDGLRDRAYISVNQVPVSVMSRTDGKQTYLTGKAGDVLDILVENQGRVTAGDDILDNHKGLTHNVTWNGTILKNWEMYPIHLENLNHSTLDLLLRQNQRSEEFSNSNLTTPSIYMGDVLVPGKPRDTFLDPRPFTKGQALINGFNLGRYWPVEGPQIRLYVPAPVLTSGVSRLVMLELERSPCVTPRNNCSVYFSNHPYINGPLGSGNL